MSLATSAPAIAAIGLFFGEALIACTAFCAANDRVVLVGNNEDFNSPFTKVWFVPAGKGSYGRVYVGFDNLFPQGGMNERGLWFDGFAMEPVKAAGSSHKPRFDGNLADKAMAACATVEEVVQLFSRYNRSFLTRAVLMFADASGDAVSIEPDAIVRKKRAYFVQTNFHQSRAGDQAPCERYRIATAMLDQAGDNISVDLFRRMLAATHQEGEYPTLYSNIYDLRRRTMHLYHFHDFENVVTFDLAEELKKGARVLDIPALFPRNYAAEAFAARRTETTRAARTAVAVATEVLDQYTGRYQTPDGSEFTIAREGSLLVATVPGYGKLPLLAESANRFFAKAADATIVFKRGARGKAGEAIVHQNGQATRAVRESQ